MRISQFLPAGALLGALVFSASAASAHPNFSPEPIRSFLRALTTLKTAHLNMARNWVLDARHADSTRFRAYRFIVPDTVMIGVAKSVTVDANGHVHIEPEPGAPFGGRPNKTHQEYSHILVPVDVTPPT